VYREKTVPQLTNLLIFGDNPSGESLLRQRRQPAEGRPELQAHPVQGQGGEQDAAAVDQRQAHVAGEKAGHPRRTCAWAWGRTASCSSLNKGDGVIRLVTHKSSPGSRRHRADDVTLRKVGTDAAEHTLLRWHRRPAPPALWLWA
jgi:hypothetical protein